MTKGVGHYKEVILRDSYLDIIAATNTAMMEYPLRLGSVNESSPTVAERSDLYILDSNFRDDDVGNEEVVERAEYLDADIIIPADELHDPQQTTMQILDMFWQLHEREYSPRVLIPLQPGEETNHVDHYNELREGLAEFGIDISDHLIAVGGVFQWSFEEQLEAIISVREHLGDDAHIHGLGIGFSEQWVYTIRKCPWLLDSIDSSSSYQNVVNGRLIDSDFNRMDFARPRGTNSTVLSVMLREFTLYMFNYMMGPHIREEDAPTELSPAHRGAKRLIDGHLNKRALAEMFGNGPASAPQRNETSKSPVAADGGQS